MKKLKGKRKREKMGDLILRQSLDMKIDFKLGNLKNIEVQRMEINNYTKFDLFFYFTKIN
eukprot:GAHX01002585.1.p1 GENE.GAHX01002585.1~~GAHX01002585.1.p1  ORF type:complete len:60 (+),score=12.45 GAHX01002585.1:131-310(+)